MSLLTKKVGVIAAQIEEIEPLIKQLDVRENSDTMFPTWEAKYHNQELLIQVVGIGKVNSSIAVQRMIHLYEVGSIYMIGIAGGLKEGLGIGDVVIGKNLIQSDFDTSVFGYDIGQIPKIDCRFFSSQDYFEYITAVKEKFAFNVVQGNYVTQDKFLTCSKTAEKLQTSFQAFAVDMEAAAVGQTCYLNKIPFTIIKSISDKAGEKSTNEYKLHVNTSIINSILVLKDLFDFQERII